MHSDTEVEGNFTATFNGVVMVAAPFGPPGHSPSRRLKDGTFLAETSCAEYQQPFLLQGPRVVLETFSHNRYSCFQTPIPKTQLTHFPWDYTTKK